MYFKVIFKSNPVGWPLTSILLVEEIDNPLLGPYLVNEWLSRRFVSCEPIHFFHCGREFSTVWILSNCTDLQSFAYLSGTLFFSNSSHRLEGSRFPPLSWLVLSRCYSRMAKGGAPLAASLTWVTGQLLSIIFHFKSLYFCFIYFSAALVGS